MQMKIRKAERKQVLCAVATAALLTAAAVSGVLNRADQTAADAWYQKPSASEGNMVLVGIDQKALEDIGPFQNWGRDTMAMVIEALNESEDCHPAVIAVDVLYAGETDPEKDGRGSGKVPQCRDSLRGRVWIRISHPGKWKDLLE